MTAEHSTLNSEELRAWLILQHAEGIGRQRLARLLSRFDSVSSVVNASATQLLAVQSMGKRTVRAILEPNQGLIEDTLSWLHQPGNHFIPLGSSDYPSLLSHCSDAPIGLFARGNIATLQQPQIAIVGSRNPDQYGLEKASDFAAALAQCGITVTSGLALGIDGAAHRAAIKAAGDTVAVLATGLDHIYPAKHSDLAHQISSQGCLVTEQALGSLPKARLFPRRNRIISGLSLGCVVVQASMRSGSLITAHSAMEQGREVFALPGSINNPLSKGCHQLIRQGAVLVETLDQILIEIKELLSCYIKNSNKFTLPQNNEIMSGTSDNVDASLNLAQDHSFHRNTDDGETTLASVERPKGNHDRKSDRQGNSSRHGDVQHELYRQMLLKYLQYDSATIDTLVDCCELSTSIVSSVLQELEIEGEVSLHGGRYSRIQR